MKLSLRAQLQHLRISPWICYFFQARKRELEFIVQDKNSKNEKYNVSYFSQSSRVLGLYLVQNLTDTNGYFYMYRLQTKFGAR